MAPLITFYGDDFTGATAVMEVLSFAGVPTMLFMEPPTPDMLAGYPDLKAVGVAGIARSKDPAWMRDNLPDVFKALRALDASVAHYKVCSTFDSSPQVGSIGAAIEIGLSVFGDKWVPLVVGAPEIGRYQVFGNLFARASNGIHRLDRHPVMACHPVTPMVEADLGKHLSKQTDLTTGVLDMTLMHEDSSAAAIAACVQAGQKIIALDAFDTASLTQAGRLIWSDGKGPTFAVGSQGVEYALVAHWRSIGTLPPNHQPPVLHPVDQIFGVSGSCAATTADQIEHAKAHGFDVVMFDASTAIYPKALVAEQKRILDTCLTRLSQGKDVIVTTNRGPDDPAIAKMNAAVKAAGLQFGTANDRLGRALGQLVAQVRETTGLRRAVIGGGDTSGHAISQLEVTALSAIAPLASGAPMCLVHSHKPKIDGFEVTLKGGQMGTSDFFIQAKNGKA